jgi:hypothetical protein
MTPAKMFEGNLWVLASDAHKMVEAAYKNGQIRGAYQERERAALKTEELGMLGYGTLAIAAAIRQGDQE